MEKLTLGCDPELFLANSKGIPVSAIGLIGGSKEEPKPIDDQGHAIQEDNVAAEFCIPPTSELLKWNDSIEIVLSHITNLVSPQGLTINIRASEEFPDTELDNPKAQEFGCDPDFNAYTLTQNPRPHCDNKNLRSAGGHIHFGHELLKDYDNAIKMVKLADVFLGLPSLFLDSDTRRRLLYGKSGCHRIKPYGVEYRTLSNFWLKTKELRKWAFNNANEAFNNLVNLGDKHLLFTDPRFQPIVQRTINEGDKRTAERLIKMFEVPMV